MSVTRLKTGYGEAVDAEEPAPGWASPPTLRGLEGYQSKRGRPATS